MKADTHTPAEIFGSDVRYLVPLFQRPYVWNRIDQWEPLWQDVSNVAGQVLDARRGPFGGQDVPPHFLGAIVLEQQWAATAYIPVRHVIDGQQRLTTLQLLLDAAQLVAEKYGNQVDARALQALVLNRKDLAQDPDEQFKVWPTDRDQDAFRAVMDNETTVPAELASSNIAQAHDYFVHEITGWAEPDGDPDKCKKRLTALTHALCRYLKLVVIDLEAGDNAQVIFETLNHRGTPLLAADLIKNFVFQLAAGQDENLPDLYQKYWKPFDSAHWRREVRQGRLKRPYVDIFINYWLTMRQLREVPADRVFTDFREMVRVSELAAWEVMRDLASDGQVYVNLENLPWDSVEGTFYYRVIKTMDTSVVAPFLLWVSRWPEEQMPIEQRHQALTSVESWLVRRMLCKATTKNYNRIMLDLLQHLDRVGPSAAGSETESFLASSRADTAYWPSDEDLAAALRETPIYHMLTRARLRMVLEALEDDMRGPWSEHQHCPRGQLTIEHIMPQAWTEHWGGDIEDVRASLRRDQLVQTLGNLTLVNERLNPALSNRPWTDTDANNRSLPKGKRRLLSEHSTLKLNAEVVNQHVNAWTEEDILRRSAELAARATRIWPCPAL
ncbi:DUF262 domain-containing protein [Actinoallomurus oryzae]|uniref:DUF262 domain-containing protein n=1 Tax=Actinoallomurus oryzae TaxID=502180 RepID=A0ABP8R2T4_9ACTN